jgi:hypothetical protein
MPFPPNKTFENVFLGRRVLLQDIIDAPALSIGLKRNKRTSY